MKSSSRVQMFMCQKCSLLKLLLLGLLTVSAIAVAELDDEYFIAHQVAQSYQIPKLLKGGDGQVLADEVIVNLAKTHEQKELIEQYYKDKTTISMLYESVTQSLLSSEFDSWLNEKIATVYMDLYDIVELKQMYKDIHTQDELSSEVVTYLSWYINSSLSYERKKEYREQLFVKELKEQTQEILDKHIKSSNEDKDGDESK